jgi:glycosyltransferase involved in cell wall biosynthesis
VPPLRRDVSIIIPACNEAKTLVLNLRCLRKWKVVQEVIVIANGCSDNTAAVAKKGGARVIEYREMLGHDTGRAIGARHAKGNILLFLDGDILWTLADLRPFVQSLRNGADIALNAYPRRASRYFHHPTAVAKRALNIVLGKPNLLASSLTAIPHAIRQSALRTIGYEALAVPPLALARAVLTGMTIVRPHHVNVRIRNQWNQRYPVAYSTKELIIGDHLQAFEYVISQRGIRAGFTDAGRMRTLIQAKDVDLDQIDQIDRMDQIDQCKVSAVIPARNEARTLPGVLRELHTAKVSHICVVENGSSDATADVAANEGALVHRYDDSLGHDVGRALGIQATSNAKCTLFLDGDFEIQARDLKVFTHSVLYKNVDVALNDMSAGLRLHQRRDSVSTLKLFLNIALRRADLGVSSLTAVPHALSHRALATIPLADLAVPPKALVRAVLSDLSVQPVHYVDVVKPNKYRMLSHSPKFGSPVSRLIIGDHVEAIALLLQHRGQRGGYVQPRNLDLLEGKSELNEDV